MPKQARRKQHKVPVLNLGHLAALNLFKADNMLSRAMSKHLSEFGLTISQHSVLAFLKANSDKGLALIDLGEMLSLSSPNITNVVDRLEEKGWVVRTDHGSDRRVKIVRLTPEGQEVEKKVFEIHGQRIEEMMKGLSQEDLERLVNLLRKLRASLEASEWLA